MKVSAVVKALEALAPPRLAADWDNVGLLIGDAAAEAKKLMLCVDLTQEVLAEALRARVEMIMAYHPVIFGPVSRFTAADTPVAYAAAAKGLAVYSMHTALDAAPGGTSDVLADVLGLADRRPLEPTVRDGRCKIVAFIPPDELSDVAEAAFAAGAGRVGNYYDCAFFCHGIGAFCGGQGAHPTVGHVGRHEVTEELRLEVVAPKSSAAAVCAAIREANSYEEPQIDVYSLEDHAADCGMGRIGKLRRPATTQTLIARIKKITGLKKVLVANSSKQTRSRKPRQVFVAACCVGSCGQLFRAAADAGATFYLTGEMRHHDVLAATAVGLTVVCLGHSNSERITLSHLAERLREEMPKLKVISARRDKDPFEIV